MSGGAFEQFQRLGADLAAQRANQIEQEHLDQRDDQLPLFNGPLPHIGTIDDGRRTTTVAILPLTPADVEHFSRVLMAKYLVRCLGLSCRDAGQLMKCDAGTVTRLARTELPLDMPISRQTVADDVLVDTRGMHEGSIHQLHRARTPHRQK